MEIEALGLPSGAIEFLRFILQEEIEKNPVGPGYDWVEENAEAWLAFLKRLEAAEVGIAATLNAVGVIITMVPAPPSVLKYKNGDTLIVLAKEAGKLRLSLGA